jgi:predicted ATPase
MRLRKLWLGNYNNLKDVEVTFDLTPSMYGSMSLRFFVGVNGSGKSNAMEAIGLIFSHLAADASPGIDFDIEYELHDQVVRITTRLDKVATARISPIDAALLVRPLKKGEGEKQEKWKPEHVRTGWATSGDGIIPGRVVGYSTGPTSSLQRALSGSIEKIVKGALGDFEEQQQPQGVSESEWMANREAQRDDLNRRYEAYLDNPATLFLGYDEALCAVLPLLAHEAGLGQKLGAHLARRTRLIGRINLDTAEPLLAFSLRIAGDWRRRLTPLREGRLAALLELAKLRTLIDPDPNNAGAADQPSRDFFAVFDLDQDFRRRKLRQPEIAPTPLLFFEELLAWKRQGALREIRLIIKKKDVEDLLLVSSLSDGEFLYLGRYALLLMLRDIPECLVLLDEPETYFNDQWKTELVKDIAGLLELGSEIPSASSHNEVIIATHSDLTLTDADPKQVYVFEYKEVAGADGNPSKKVSVSRPAFSTFAANRGDVPRGLYQSPASTGAYAKDAIEDALTSGDKKQIEELLEAVGPGFHRFRLKEKLMQLDEQAGQ